MTQTAQDDAHLFILQDVFCVLPGFCIVRCSRNSFTACPGGEGDLRKFNDFFNAGLAQEFVKIILCELIFQCEPEFISCHGKQRDDRNRTFQRKLNDKPICTQGHAAHDPQMCLVLLQQHIQCMGHLLADGVLGRRGNIYMARHTNQNRQICILDSFSRKRTSHIRFSVPDNYVVT
ncbi:hypothetical protein GL297_08600 [Komagataeibacter sp. FXV2]|nr:hypothetical protein [Komagataeibacter sp. FXV2]